MNPYHDLPPERYWRTGVQVPAQSGAGYPHLWQSKFPIDRETKIITVGSCFAQHISKWIKSNGFVWVDSEPGDASRSLKEREDDGYGVFSFRTGNIYTPALLKQWVYQALQLEQEVDEVYVSDGRYFDAFRPLIPAQGYADPAEVFAARQRTLACIRKALHESTLFIFTLGLTEGWINKAGYVYPLCPGTVKGEFKPDQHAFVNYNFEQVVGDLNAVMDAITAVNPRMRFLLTVSPVPLTATAETMHVLTATTYSKSVLRAAAGHLAATRPEVDYFPSYELIAQFPSQGKFYEANLRSVKKTGVDFVMHHFALGIGVTEPALKLPQDNSLRASKVNATDSVDAYCEEILLEAWNQSTPDTVKDIPISVFVAGDSHMDATAGALSNLGIANRGGMIMRGHTWANGGFELDAEEIFVPLDGPIAREKWRQTIDALQRSDSREKYMITNIGLHTNVNVPRLFQWANINQLTSINAEQVAQFFHSINQKNLALIQAFMARGLNIVVITDPPTQSLNPAFVPLIPLTVLYEQVATQIYGAMGCTVVQVRSAYPDGIPEAFYSTQLLGAERDWVHGSASYYSAAAGLLCSALSDLGLPSAKSQAR